MNEAYNSVCRNKGIAEVDGVTVEELKEYLKQHKERILREIRERKYKPQPVLQLEIPKENGKKRKLGIPTVVDRVIQQSILQILSPIYEKQFSESSYGFRPGRSCEQAVIKSLELLNDEYDWIVDIDLERFFDTIHHDRLMNLISRTIKDGDVISLIRKYLVSGVLVRGKVEKQLKGTPQGGNLSPLLSNIMLNELDKELESRGLNFVRYADDCNIYVRSEKAAIRVMKSVTMYIEKKLGLQVNVEKNRVGRPWEIKFLGYGYYKNKTGKYKPKPHLKSLKKLQKKLKGLSKRSWSISLDERLKRLNDVIRGWVNYYKICDMKKAVEKMDKKLRSRLRVVIWKQWKRNRKRILSLEKLGIGKEEAKGLTYCRKGYRFIGNSCVLQRALSNKRLKKRGLVSLLDHYLKVHTEI
jgi:group II intron reverse transcriptase/maturase